MVSYRSQLVVLCLCAALSGCQKQAQPPTATAPATSGAPAQPATSTGAPAAAAAGAPAGAPSAPPIASAQYGADPDLRCDLLEVKRVSGGAVLIRWRVVNTAGSAAAGLAASQPKQINYDFNWPEIYYIDPAENKKYNFLTDAEGQRILDVYWGNLAAGQQRGNWAKFPAPPATSKRISVNIPKFPPFEDVPVAE